MMRDVSHSSKLNLSDPTTVQQLSFLPSTILESISAAQEELCKESLICGDDADYRPPAVVLRLNRTDYISCSVCNVDGEVVDNDACRAYHSCNNLPADDPLLFDATANMFKPYHIIMATASVLATASTSTKSNTSGNDGSSSGSSELSAKPTLAYQVRQALIATLNPTRQENLVQVSVSTTFTSPTLEVCEEKPRH